MKLKFLFLAGVVAIFTLSTAVAKSYDVAFASPTKAGSLQLKAGGYRLSVSGNKVTFTAVDTEKSVTTEVKVENADKKFVETKVDSTNEGGTTVVQDIELGGSKIKLDF
jgi:copper(I)-binding protein